jgi:hypothetical protein
MQTSIFVAWAEKTAKFVPWPSQVAPSGKGLPSLTRDGFWLKRQLLQVPPALG